MHSRCHSSCYTYLSSSCAFCLFSGERCSLLYCSIRRGNRVTVRLPCEKKSGSCEGAPWSRDTIGPPLFMSIVRVFPLSRGFVTFPRLLFWRLPSAHRPALLPPSLLSLSLLLLTPLPRHTSPSFSPFFSSQSGSSVVPLALVRARGAVGGISRLLRLFSPGGERELIGRWRPLLRGKWSKYYVI